MDAYEYDAMWLYVLLSSQLAMYFVCKMIMSIGQMLLMLIVPDTVYAYCNPFTTYCRTIGIVLFFCVTIDHLLFCCIS